MNAFLLMLLRSSCGMAGVALLYGLAARLLWKRYCARSFYRAGVLILLGFLIPARPTITFPAFAPAEAWPPAAGANLFQGGGIPLPGPEAASLPPEVLFGVWLLGAAAVLLYHGARHLRFMKTVRRWSADVTEARTLKVYDRVAAGTAPRPKLKTCACAAGPMLAWLGRPVILLPEGRYDREELELILRHEMVHYKRKDLPVRVGLVLAAALNWFNPAVYLFAGVFTRFCELACDEQVTGKLDRAGRRRYALAIIRAANGKSGGGTAFSTAFYGGKESMKNRISFVMNPLQKRRGAILLAGTFILTLAAGVAFAASANTKGAANPPQDWPAYTYGAPTQAEVDKEIQAAFSEVFSPSFEPGDFGGAAITYAPDGVPVVDAPDTPSRLAVYAGATEERNGFYSAAACDGGQLIFYVPQGKTVEVTDSASNTAAAKVKYAGAAGYMKKANLRF